MQSQHHNRLCALRATAVDCCGTADFQFPCCCCSIAIMSTVKQCAFLVYMIAQPCSSVSTFVLWINSNWPNWAQTLCLEERSRLRVFFSCFYSNTTVCNVVQSVVKPEMQSSTTCGINSAQLWYDTVTSYCILIRSTQHACLGLKCLVSTLTSNTGRHSLNHVGSITKITFVFVIQLECG